ncbi:hypothetical protein [Pseudomonas chlororaphis]|uniref:Uncharacterized protein n=1 Tax=Pseudomonas chlororaphis TaxID=587753 RepID=A0A1Q8EQM2_9PSED|nr:hypothetical protein [Pseudomonas chlororaphis]OLF54095.1 hypothetical protein BTN82_13655 [Pseudomonas chlororaphis]
MDEPILYLGDRGFLKRYASPYSAQQVEEIARGVLASSGLGLASGDWPTARAVSSALGDGPRARHLYHSRFLLRVTERATGQAVGVRQIQANPAFYYDAPGYDFAVDVQQIAEDIQIIRCCQPGRVTLGGDWLDILLAQREYALLDVILRQMEAAIPAASRILLGFHLSAGFLQLLRERSFSGAAVPVNLLNMQCTTYSDYLRRIQAHSRLYAVHCLAGGDIPLEPALDYAFHHIQVDACIVGATQPRHIEALAACEAGFRSSTR